MERNLDDHSGGEVAGGSNLLVFRDGSFVLPPEDPPLKESEDPISVTVLPSRPSSKVSARRSSRFLIPKRHLSGWKTKTRLQLETQDFDIHNREQGHHTHTNRVVLQSQSASMKRSRHVHKSSKSYFYFRGPRQRQRTSNSMDFRASYPILVSIFIKNYTA